MDIFEYMYQQHFKKGIVPTLDRIKGFYDQFSIYTPSEKIIHVAGTNGKGSTTAFLKSILESAGYSVAVFTSPHINDITERFYCNRRFIEKKELEQILIELKNSVDEYQNRHPYHFITFFEYMTLAALLWFYKENPDYIILEVGMGGLYDATNIINAKYGAITSIDFDHTSYLGDTIEAIAIQKAGIIKTNQFVVVGEMSEKATNIINSIAKEKNAVVVDISESKISENENIWFYKNFEINLDKRALKGEYQKINSKIAIALSIEIIPNITEDIIIKGISKAYWPGRFEIMSESPLIIRDVAHNPQGVDVLSQSLKKLYKDRKKITIFGVMKDKNYSEMLEKIAEFSETIIITTPPVERAAEIELLKNELDNSLKFKNITISENPQNALTIAKRMIQNDNDMIIVTGSIYLMEFIEF
ncbi:bifunctional folylpolyglutamate synthase/dihydrofolate synthase [bacterium]|nr:bifunctional folylpolyglutamate synthase/dihydrofolate synthase [bacterium]